MDLSGTFWFQWSVVLSRRSRYVTIPLTKACVTSSFQPRKWLERRCILIPPGLGIVSSLVPTDSYIIWEIYGRSVVRAFQCVNIGPSCLGCPKLDIYKQASGGRLVTPGSVCYCCFLKMKEAMPPCLFKIRSRNYQQFAIIFVHPCQGWNTLIFQNPLAGFGALLSSDPVWVPTWTDSWYDLMTAWESGWVGLILGNLGLGLTVLKKVLERGSCLAEATVSQFSTL